MIVFIAIIVIAVIAVLIIELREFDAEMKAGYDRILKNIESTYDSVKTFLTITLIDKISNAFDTDSTMEDDSEDVSGD